MTIFGKPAVVAGALLFSAAAASIEIDHVVSFGPGSADTAEIAAFDPISQRLFVTNPDGNRLERYDLSDPSSPIALTPIDLAAYGAAPNSVDVANGLVAVAVEANPATDPGRVVFFDADGNLIDQVTVGSLPDMLAFTPDGTKVLVANEGEPSSDYTIDPEGSVAIIDLGAPTRGGFSVTFADFSAFNGATLDPSIRVFGPGASVAQDLEPEYIAIDETGTTAWVSLQENNAMAVLDIASATVTDLIGLGFKDHSLPGNALDASDRDGPGGSEAINIVNWPIFGVYQPDAIDVFTVGGVPYVVTANEGDARDYAGFSEEVRAADLTLDTTAFPDAASLQLDENLGRINVTTTLGDAGSDGDYDALYAYGARSFSIYNGVTGAQVFDSGSDFEDVTAGLGLPFFNDDDGRSDNKGPEPEGIVTGVVDGRRYAFIGLERVSGFFAYDLSQPTAPMIETFIQGEPGNERPEGVIFVPSSDSPNGENLLLLTHEDSGTVAIYTVRGGMTGPVGPAIAVPVLGTSGLLWMLLLMMAPALLVLSRMK
jgi:DNA-binding beta-propeller fold protein YncE